MKLKEKIEKQRMLELSEAKRQLLVEKPKLEELEAQNRECWSVMERIEMAGSSVKTDSPIEKIVPNVQRTSVNPNTKTTGDTDQPKAKVRSKNPVHTVQKGLVHQYPALEAGEMTGTSASVWENSASAGAGDPKTGSWFAVHPIVRDAALTESQTVSKDLSNRSQDAARPVQKGLVRPHNDSSVSTVLDGSKAAETFPLTDSWTRFPLRHGLNGRVVQKGLIRPQERIRLQNIALDSKGVQRLENAVEQIAEMGVYGSLVSGQRPGDPHGRHVSRRNREIEKVKSKL